MFDVSAGERERQLNSQMLRACEESGLSERLFPAEAKDRLGSRVRIRLQRELSFATADIGMSIMQPEAASTTPTAERLEWPTGTTSTLQIEWLIPEWNRRLNV